MRILLRFVFPFDICSFVRLHYFKSLFFFFQISKAVIQYFEVEADNEYVIRGNSAIMKCKIPSYISDFVSVDLWKDTENNTFTFNSTQGLRESYKEP